MRNSVRSPRRNRFNTLAAWTIGLGLMAGVLFPAFGVMRGIPHEALFTPGFFATTLIAGVLIDIANFVLDSQ